jgi:hypothetical protein
MTGAWHLQDDTAPLTGERAVALVRRRVEQGQLETWLEHDQGKRLAVVSNRIRALVLLIDDPGDAGVHAIDPAGKGRQDGYVLGDGRRDIHDNRDTLPLGQALRTVEHIVEHDCPPADVSWQLSSRAAGIS